MRLNPSFNPAARNVLRDLEKKYAALIGIILSDVTPNSSSIQHAKDYLEVVSVRYREKFYSQFKDEASFKRWLKKPAPDRPSVKSFYLAECRALDSRKPSPAIALERIVNPQEMLRLESEYDQFVQAYETFIDSLATPKNRSYKNSNLVSRRP